MRPCAVCVLHASAGTVDVSDIRLGSVSRHRGSLSSPGAMASCSSGAPSACSLTRRRPPGPVSLPRCARVHVLSHMLTSAERASVSAGSLQGQPIRVTSGRWHMVGRGRASAGRTMSRRLVILLGHRTEMFDMVATVTGCVRQAVCSFGSMSFTRSRR